jgi:CDP-L-myo-inositol myo-inositolphosphotransferase
VVHRITGAMESPVVRWSAVVEFESARQAGRRIAGVAAAARIVRELALAGFAEAWIAVRSNEPLGEATDDDIARLAGGMAVHTGSPSPEAHAQRFPGHLLVPAPAVPHFIAGRPVPSIRLDRASATAELLRGTGKPTDGVVSRWLNRPISRRLSALLLRVPGARPIHATAGTALLALAMFVALVAGGHPGLIAGALLFHAASVFDGVDGEMARVTFRTSSKGAAIDSAVDLATNVAAMLGLGVNLSLRGDPEALLLALWGSSLLLVGLAMIGWRSLREAGSIGFDGIKQRYRRRVSGRIAAGLMRLATLGTSRDFCAVVYLALVLLGIPIAGLYLFAVVTPVWIMFVVAALWSSRHRDRAARQGAA